MTKIQTKIWREGSLLAGVDCRPTRRLICIAWQGCFQRRRPFTCYKAGMRCMSLFLDFRPSVGWLIFIFPLAPFIQAEFTLFSSSIPQALLLGFLLSSFLIFFFLFFLSSILTINVEQTRRRYWLSEHVKAHRHLACRNFSFFSSSSSSSSSPPFFPFIGGTLLLRVQRFFPSQRMEIFLRLYVGYFESWQRTGWMLNIPFGVLNYWSRKKILVSSPRFKVRNCFELKYEIICQSNYRSG